MKIKFSAFIKEFNYKGLVSGDKSIRLIFHELQCTEQDQMLLSVAPTNLKFTVEMTLEENNETR